MKYIYSTSQMSKLSLTLHTFSVTGSVAGLFLTKKLSSNEKLTLEKQKRYFDNLYMYYGEKSH